MDENKLREIEGLQTVETVAESLNITTNSALNLLSRLKKQGYVSRSGGGKQKRLYKITLRKQRKRDKGMFDIINKYSPNMKLHHWHDHQVHGNYTVEDALLDAIETKSFRAILASLRLFNHIKDWKKLYNGAKKRGIWQQTGALYDLARMHFRVRKIPKSYLGEKFPKKDYIIREYAAKEGMFRAIEKKWNICIPFRKGDMQKVIYDYA